MIRRATPADIPRIAEILVFAKRTAYRSIFQNDYFSFQELQVHKVMKEYEDNQSLLDEMWVYDDGILKGIICGNEDQSCKGETELGQFYVEPFFQGMGIGRSLLKHFLRQAKRKGTKRVGLWVLKDNAPARRFYEQNGFCLDGQKQINEGTEIWDVRYVKDILEGRGCNDNTQ